MLFTARFSIRFGGTLDATGRTIMFRGTPVKNHWFNA